MIRCSQRAVQLLQRASSQSEFNLNLQHWLSCVNAAPGGSLSRPSCAILFGRGLQTVTETTNDPPPGLLLGQYHHLVARGRLRADPNQERCATRLSELFDQLPAYRFSNCSTYLKQDCRLATSSSKNLAVCRAAVDEFETRHRVYQELRQQKREELLAAEAAEEAAQQRREAKDGANFKLFFC